MASQTRIEQVERSPQIQHWNLATRIAFRFCFVYLGIYCLTTQVFGGLVLPNLAFNSTFPDPGTLWPMRQIIFWTARHLFHVTSSLVYGDAGSGDKIYDWTQLFCILIFAVFATVIWSVLDRRRQSYIMLHKWFRLFIRFALASEMLLYAMYKVIPLQMPFPVLSLLVEPFGHLSPMGVLWASIGAAPAYEIFAGSAEMLGGLLLLVPYTTTLGALICLADLTNVFTLNMTYDVPVKLFSFHLLLMALFLLAPDLPRLANLFFRNRAAGPSTQPQLFRTRRANRGALAAQIIFGIYLLGMLTYSGLGARYVYGDRAPKPKLYGIWDVSQMSIDGKVRSPLLNDYGRWRRVIFEAPDNSFLLFQHMDDSFGGYLASINSQNKTITLAKSSDKKWKALFTYQRPTQDQLILDGEMDNHKIHIQLQLFDTKKFRLISRGFHWIQEYPYNR
ncbi:MAG TPA: hypothetical protein VGR94_03385 [Candidatus Acidoferrales bacterium]|nr:hypothetical protein [Candidatus Acidoferrales bacterium]